MFLYTVQYRIGVPCAASLAAANEADIDLRSLVDPCLTFGWHRQALIAALPFECSTQYPAKPDGLDPYDTVPCKQLPASGRPPVARKRKTTAYLREDVPSPKRLSRVRCLVCGSAEHTKQRCTQAGNIGEEYILKCNLSYQKRQMRLAQRSKVSIFLFFLSLC